MKGEYRKYSLFITGMLKTGKILAFLFILNYLYCAPDRYLRDNRHNNSISDYPQTDEDYAWYDTEENTVYGNQYEYNSHRPQAETDIPDNHYYKKIPPASIKNTYSRKQRPSYVIYSKNEEHGDNKTPVIKSKRYPPTERKIIKQPESLTSYKIRNGDSLTGIARRFNMDVDIICRMNKIKNPNDIYAGMTLKIAPRKNYDRTKAICIDKPDNKPLFEWPLRNVISVKRDGNDGVRSIGIIITGKDGSKIYSSAAGTVKKIGQMRGFGNFIILKHPDRFFTIYSNLNDISVSEGEKVVTGKIIGRLDGTRLHFQIDNSGKPEDPLKYLSRRR